MAVIDGGADGTLDTSLEPAARLPECRAVVLVCAAAPACPSQAPALDVSTSSGGTAPGIRPLAQGAARWPPTGGLSPQRAVRGAVSRTRARAATAASSKRRGHARVRRLRRRRP
ncbi:hypothetical protein [Streptomyces sp. NPDC018967]|uniref:hypothetical protein n=1 Tax=Streptomyces sp. NPDC018967 TaxID=3365059 RepID=UPI0037A4F24B